MKAIDYVKNLIFPKYCFGCGIIDLYFCKDCINTIEPQPQQKCIICSKLSIDGYTHQTCKSSQSPERLITIYSYKDSIIKAAINGAKFRYLKDVFIELTLMRLKTLSLPHLTICPIPMTKGSLKSRGFNQSTIISQAISKFFKLYNLELLIKKRQSRSQKDLSKAERLNNLLNSFTINPKYNMPSFVLLIDDVITTGSTLLECTKILKQSGVKRVWCLALAQD